MKNNEIFKNNILFYYIDKKKNLEGVLETIEKLNKIIIEKFGYHRYYFNTIVKEFILNNDKLLENILNSRSIPKEDLDNIKSQFVNEIKSNYDKLLTNYSKNFEKLLEKFKSKLDSLKQISYRHIFSIDKKKIKDDIQQYSKEKIGEYNETNNIDFSLIIQSELYNSLKNIIINYENDRNKEKKGKKIELKKFKDFIKNNINIIENDIIELENVATDKGDWCDYSKEKKDAYIEEKYKSEKENLQKYYNILKENSNKQRDKYIKDYLEKLTSSFGDYHQEEKKP